MDTPSLAATAIFTLFIGTHLLIGGLLGTAACKMSNPAKSALRFWDFIFKFGGGLICASLVVIWLA